MAITYLAAHVLENCGTAVIRDDATETAILRAASAGVLFNEPVELVKFKCQRDLAGESDLHEYDDEWDAKRTDWLGYAIGRLQSEGIEVKANAQQQRTPYGWREAPAAQPSEAVPRALRASRGHVELLPRTMYLHELILKGRSTTPSDPAAQFLMANHLRKTLASLSFYQRSAEPARRRGDEMMYWVSLQG